MRADRRGLGISRQTIASLLVLLALGSMLLPSPSATAKSSAYEDPDDTLNPLDVRSITTKRFREERGYVYVNTVRTYERWTNRQLYAYLNVEDIGGTCRGIYPGRCSGTYSAFIYYSRRYDRFEGQMYEDGLDSEDCYCFRLRVTRPGPNSIRFLFKSWWFHHKTYGIEWYFETRPPRGSNQPCIPLHVSPFSCWDRVPDAGRMRIYFPEPVP